MSPGRFLFNGNIGSPGELAARVAPWLRGRDGGSPRVLLVTAAWGPNEYDEGAAREAFNAVGVRSDWRGGFDQAIYNLCSWHTWQEYLARHPGVAAVDAELRAAQEATRRFYVDKTRFHAERVRQAARGAREALGEFRIGDLPLAERDAVRPAASMTGQELFRRALVRELSHDLADLARNDQRMMQALGEEEALLAARTGLRVDDDWLREQRRLAERILRADVICLFGGDPGALLASLRFFDLRHALLEALRRGATFVSVSAGSLVLCERIVVYDNFNPDPAHREFRLHDKGLGLVGGLQVLPHCMDRIHTDDPDNLAYLARRFSSRLCVGLNEESFLLVEPSVPQARSVGEHDGVFVFGPDGVKWRYSFGEQIPLRDEWP